MPLLRSSFLGETVVQHKVTVSPVAWKNDLSQAEIAFVERMTRYCEQLDDQKGQPKGLPYDERCAEFAAMIIRSRAKDRVDHYSTQTLPQLEPQLKLLIRQAYELP